MRFKANIEKNDFIEIPARYTDRDARVFQLPDGIGGTAQSL